METQDPTPPAGRARGQHPTIATIASEMGLSRATVTHVLNGRGAQQRISPETQQRVLEVALRLGYRPNASARAIRAGRFGSIGLVQALRGLYLPPLLLDGLSRAVTDLRMHLVMTQVPDDVIDDEAYFPHALSDLSVDGVLVNRHTGCSQAFIRRLHELHIPAVFINVGQEYDCVHPDEVGGGRMATAFLQNLGHERIAYVDKDEPGETHFSVRDRHAGYVLQMEDAGCMPWRHSLPSHWEITGRLDADARVESARELLARPDRPTAVVAYELTEAITVTRAASLLGLRIPQDLSIVQFHDWIDDHSFIPIHTVCNVMHLVGAEAARMIVEKIDRPETALPARIVPMHLIPGASCMPPGAN